jgi:hypothetical protein
LCHSLDFAVAKVNHCLGTGCHIVFMGHENDRDSLSVQLIKQVQNVIRRARVQSSGGLIGEEESWLIDNRSRNSHPLLLAT